VNKISVAVLVDGTYSKNDKGDVIYQPRTKDEVERIAALVRTAIGFDQKRGDQVEVVNLRFAEPPVASFDEPTGWLSTLQMTKDDIMHGAELIVMALLSVLVLLFVVRPLVRRIITPDDTLQLAAPAASLGERPAAIAERTESKPIPPSQTAQMIDVAQVQGQVHAQSLTKVGDLAQRNPQETVSIIRQWLHESAA
jgi:flagellar M-ring protein FliF